MTWTKETITALFDKPFMDLIFEAQGILRENFTAGEVQMSQLLSIKTGGCPEDCGYCSQSSHHETGLKAGKLMDKDSIMQAAQVAKDGGASRFCMGAAWRSLKERDVDTMCDIIHGVKSLGLETCVTLGMLEDGQAERLKAAGLDYYNHNLDTSREFYDRIITTRCYDDRLDTLEKVRTAGLKTCCGGIMGLGETRADRIAFLFELAQLPEAPQSIPINALVPVKGTKTENAPKIDDLEFIRIIAAARIMFPRSMVRLSAGRDTMSDTMQALCFLAGANSIFVGEELLTTPNPGENRDNALFAALGLQPMNKVA